jgi:periplasmic protein TonB
MKTIPIYFAFTLFTLISCSDKKETVSTSDEVSHQYDKQAVPSEGLKIFYENFANSFVVTDSIKTNNSIKVMISFVVETDGSLSDLNVLKAENKEYGNQAIEILKSMPKWIPAELNGNPVRSLYTLPITINLS